MSKNNKKSGGWSSSWFDFDSWKSPISKKRAEIVKPYMSWWDQNKICREIRDNNKEFFHTVGRGKGTSDQNLKDINDNGDVNVARKFYKDFITEDLIHDIYSIYYNKSENIRFDSENDSNKVKFKILEKVNNSLLKIVSNNNSIASFMYTREICNFLFTEMWNAMTDSERNELMKAMKDMNSMESDDESEDSDSNSNSSKGKGKSKGNNKSKKGNEKSNGNESDEDDSDSEENGNNSQNSNKNKGKGREDKSDSEQKEEGENDSEKNSSSDKGEKSSGNPQKGDGNCDQGDENGEGKSKAKDTSGGQDASGNLKKEEIDEWKRKNEERKAKEKTVNDKLAEKIDNLFKTRSVQQRFDDAISQADKLMTDLEKAGINLDRGDLAGVTEILNLNNIRHDIAQLAINKHAIAEAIKNILDNSLNYFSKRYQTREIDLFEADEISEIFGIEYIHPVFKSSMLDRLTTEERKPLGRIDLYIDVSGSMGSGSGIPGVSNMMFAKSIALAMLNMDMLNNLYVFDTSVRQVEATELGILMISDGGGTSIDCVTRHIINKAKHNGICLTDGECSVSEYDERMFLLGTIGVYFNYFYNCGEAGLKFLQNGQCINFDGTTVNKIVYQESYNNRRR